MEHSVENEATTLLQTKKEASPTNRAKLIVPGLLVAVVGAIGIVHQGGFQISPLETSLSSDSSALIARNDYGIFGEKYNFYGRIEMVEPYITTTLSLDKAPVGSEFIWEVETDNDVYEYVVGDTAEVIFKATGKLSVSWCELSSPSSSSSLKNDIKEGHGQGKIKGFVGHNAPTNIKTSNCGSSSVHGIYVRREMRSLTESDRKAFFETAEIVFRMPTHEGKVKYGDKYFSAGHLASLHNELSGNTNCDHLHDGLGFLTSHAALTLMFEQALQAINPRVSVPYWDYTIDVTDYELSGDISSLFNSEVFGEDYFGASGSSDDDLTLEGLVDPVGRVVNGLFTEVEMSMSYWGISSSVHNAYGMIRSPWNTNNDPYVNRFKRTYGFPAVSRRLSTEEEKEPMSEEDIAELKEAHEIIKKSRHYNGEKLSTSASTTFGSADCETIYDVMQYDTWYYWGMNVEYEPHGPIHTLIGGTSGGNYKAALHSHVNMKSHLVEAWSLVAFGLFKDMWRDGKVSCPDTCSTDTPTTECKCSCVHLDEWTKSNAASKKALKSIDYNVFVSDIFTTDVDGNDVSTAVVKTLCNAYDELNPVIGEMLQSSAPMDISFWPTHPFVDRLFHWKMLKTGFTDTHWGKYGEDEVSSCYGHSHYDIVGWKNLFDEDDKPYTNAELWDLSNPTADEISDYKLPYVYDDFLWSHCLEVGYSDTLFAK